MKRRSPGLVATARLNLVMAAAACRWGAALGAGAEVAVDPAHGLLGHDPQGPAEQRLAVADPAVERRARDAQFGRQGSEVHPAALVDPLGGEAHHVVGRGRHAVDRTGAAIAVVEQMCIVFHRGTLPESVSREGDHRCNR
jgi:hypothetical protein